ncbi:LOG family protein [Croceiramulus getboli]|nr:TIGR00730 family Rossman fold protein [Flavobacteriaceae bacterium YJPT1-3]
MSKKTNTLKSICVFCGSSPGRDSDILAAARSLGTELAQSDRFLVYGGSKIGVMGAVAQSTLDAGGKVIGIIPDFLKTKEVVHLELQELIVTENMHERKMIMHERSDAFITLPGGFGTLEELFEIITWSQLGLHQKPIGLLNINGFFDPLLAQLKQMVEVGFLKPENAALLLVDTTVAGLLTQMESYLAVPVTKWLDLEDT